jgi:hypothetical protein
VAREDSAAQNWLHPWSGPYDWTSTSEWKSVPQSKLAEAEELLGNVPVIGITEAQVSGLLGEPTHFSSEQTIPYLLRAVGPHQGRLPLQSFVRPNGDIWIGGEAISRCAVPKERRAVVAWLPKKPNEVFVTFGVAK